MAKRVMALTALIAAVLAIPVSGTRYSFVPDWTFKGSTLTGWHTVGQVDWKATNGELVGTPKSPDGGWLLLDKGFQDVQVGFDFKTTGGVKTGVLLRAEKTPAGMKGIYVSLNEGEQGAFAVTLDANGKELTRERLRPGGGLMRVAPTAAAAAGGSSGARSRGRAGAAAHRARRHRGAPARAQAPAARRAGQGAAAAGCFPRGRNFRTSQSRPPSSPTTGTISTS